MNQINADFETRSTVDLRKTGLYPYAEHPTTDVLCLAWQWNDMPIRLWIPPHMRHLVDMDHDAEDKFLASSIYRADVIAAWNAAFERAIWNAVMAGKYGWAHIPLGRWYCSAAAAAALALPRALGSAAEALKLPVQKNPQGYRLINKWSKPYGFYQFKEGNFDENGNDLNARYNDGDAMFEESDKKSFKELCDYCVTDVAAEKGISDSIRPLPASEIEVWRMDQRINDRGIPIDTFAVSNLLDIVADAVGEEKEKVKQITGGEVQAGTQVQKSLDWLKSQGINLASLDKTSVAKALDMELPDHVRAFLESRGLTSKASVSKLKAMKAMCAQDGRVHGAFLYHGASTGRWAGKGIQPQNLPRDSYTDPKDVDLAVLGAHTDSPLLSASRSIRGCIAASPGKMLWAVDFASIEARVLAWLAGEEYVLQNFRDKVDPYKVAASNIYQVGYEFVTKPQRQVGKVAELALGYQGWINAFRTMATGYGISLLTEEQKAELVQKYHDNPVIEHPADNERVGKIQVFFRSVDSYIEAEEDHRAGPIILAWRNSHPMTKAFWRGLEDAAIDAVETGKCYSYRLIKFMVKDGFLYMRLPSGRLLAYYQPTVEVVTDKYKREKKGIKFWSVNGYTKKWEETFTYGGKLAENVTQAVARDFLVEAMQRIESAGHPIVMHVHDEIVGEEESPDIEALENLCRISPTWALDCPIGTDGWVCRRYKK